MINEQRMNKAFQELLNGYFESDEISLFQNQKIKAELVSDFNSTTCFEVKGSGPFHFRYPHTMFK